VPFMGDVDGYRSVNFFRTSTLPAASSATEQHVVLHGELVETSLIALPSLERTL
jgi:hypothetical protein